MVGFFFKILDFLKFVICLKVGFILIILGFEVVIMMFLLVVEKIVVSSFICLLFLIFLLIFFKYLFYLIFLFLCVIGEDLFLIYINFLVGWLIWKILC